jgi:hypothetical protein
MQGLRPGKRLVSSGGSRLAFDLWIGASHATSGKVCCPYLMVETDLATLRIGKFHREEIEKDSDAVGNQTISG